MHPLRYRQPPPHLTEFNLVLKFKLISAEAFSFAGKVAHYKQLKGGVQFVDMIPKSPSGKILRRQLKQAYGTMKSKL